MVPQVSVYLSDALADAVKKQKETINVSQVCAAALRSELSKLERLEKGKHDRQALIERLRAEKQDTLARSARFGRETAEEWVKTASYDELRIYAEAAPERRPRLPEGVIEAAMTEDAMLRDGPSSDPWYRPELLDDRAFTDGWYAQVREIWQEIKDEV